MSASNQQDTSTENQDASDPNNLLYYVPRRLCDRANSLHTAQFDAGQALELRHAPSLEPPVSDEPLNALPKSSTVPEPPGGMESVWRLRQRSRKRQVLGPTLRFAGVAGLAAGLTTAYVLFTEPPDKQAASEAAVTPKVESRVMSENVVDTKVTTETAAATIDEPGSVDVKISNLNPVDVTTPSLPAATPEENAALYREFLRWQQTSAQRDVPAARPNVSATRDQPPRRKRKARRRQVDDE